MQADTAALGRAAAVQVLPRGLAGQKLRTMARLNRMARTLALSGIRSRYPQAPAELRRRLADKLLGLSSPRSCTGRLPATRRRLNMTEAREEISVTLL